MYILRRAEGGARGSIYIQHEGGTVPCTMRQLPCTVQIDRITTGLASALECLHHSARCALAVQRKVPHARRCSYSSIA